MPDLTAGDAKLVQYLNEAYGTESRLETALEAHIAMTTKASYKKRLREHLSETKRHARDVQRRVKQLGGTPETFSTPGPDQVGEAAQAVIGGAQKAVALAQGPLHALRGTGAEEKQLKNAKTEYASESEEIATYSAIETLAASLGDRETQQLARSILREEQRMRSFLEREITSLTKAVVKAEVPASQRKASKPARKKTRSNASRGVSKAASSARATAGGTKAKASGAKTKAKASGAKTKATAKATRTKTKAKAKATRTKAKAARAR